MDKNPIQVKKAPFNKSNKTRRDARECVGRCEKKMTGIDVFKRGEKASVVLGRGRRL